MKASILFAEDDTALQGVIADQLRGEGYTVTPAADGLEAVSKLETGHYDLALLDIRMPGMDGLQVLGAIRTRYPRMRIVMLTGVDDFAVALEAIKLGADDYVTKPFSLADLLSCIERAIER